MSLGDVMSGTGLHIYAEVALLLFAGALLAVAISTLLRRNRELFERARFMPLRDDDAPATAWESAGAIADRPPVWGSAGAISGPPQMVDGPAPGTPREISHGAGAISGPPQMVEEKTHE